MRAYLDHNATSPLRPEALKAVLAAMETGGNPSSIHAEGRAARAIVDDARAVLAKTLGVLPQMLVFTGVGTEANNYAVKGADVDRIIISAIEHPCVVDAATATGKPVEIIPVDENGIIDLDQLEQVLKRDEGRALVCLMLANNETGAIQPVRKAAQLAADNNAMIHCDAVQAYGKIPVNFGLLGVDTMTLSAHKIGGPQGTGLLVVRDGVNLAKHNHGGGQELGRRGGTENIAGIAGFAAAAIPACEIDSGIRQLRDEFESRLEEISPQVVIFSRDAERLPNTCFFAHPGMKAQTSLINLDLGGIAVSTGSACSSGKVTGSRVLNAMGVSDELRECALRISFGWTSSQADIDKFFEIWQSLIAKRKTNG